MFEMEIVCRWFSFVLFPFRTVRQLKNIGPTLPILSTESIVIAARGRFGQYRRRRKRSGRVPHQRPAGARQRRHRPVRGHLAASRRPGPRRQPHVVARRRFGSSVRSFFLMTFYSGFPWRFKAQGLGWGNNDFRLPNRVALVRRERKRMSLTLWRAGSDAASSRGRPAWRRTPKRFACATAGRCGTRRW